MSRVAFVVASVWVGGLAVLAAAAPPPTESPQAVQLQGWVRDLDSDDYSVRETATRELTAAGPDAIEALAHGVVSASPETAWRASEALQEIALHGDETALARVAAALDSASRAGKPGAETIVRDLRIRQQKLRHDRAAAKLRSLGAKLAGDDQPQIAVWGGGFIGGDLGPGRVVLEGGGPIDDLDAPDKPQPLKAMEATLERLTELIAPAVEDVAAPPVAAEPARVVEEMPAEVAPPEVAPADAAPADIAPIHEAPAEIPEIAPEAPAVEVPTAEAPVAEVPIADAQIAEVPVEPAQPAVEAPAETPLEEPAPPPEDVPLHVEDEPLVEIAPDAIVADAIFIGDAFGSDLVDSAHAVGGLTQSLALDADWKGGDEGLAALRDLPSLVQISVQGAPLTDAALPHLAALPKLAELSISDTKFSAAALSKLRAERKNLRIIARGPALLGIHAEMTGPCVLSGIHNGSGAETAGLKAGDQVVAIDGNAIQDFSDLTIAVYAHAPGDTLKVEVLRDRQKRTFDVVLKGRGDLER